ncbi:TMEM144 family transporter [Skeletonema marinoi]|uniref:TMEM144 family transporter n=1 Tax=Skeletonema marinoi TaxID=267567 RepID=A0AAD8Y8P0_9STRA|nr:TMEM144 family transporter [Skeletonema marinoi]
MAEPNLVLGWFAAFVGAIGFGSFAVPIKGDAATKVDIDPLVMQSYKSLMCFLTSWLVVLLGQQVTFTWWGVVSGLFWVPGGAFNIFAIRNAGLAISQGIVASSIVMVSFIWGNIIFKEPAKSQVMAYLSVWLIMGGLYGMSYYSTSDWVDNTDHHHDHEATSSDHDYDFEEDEQDAFLNDGSTSSASYENEPSPSNPLANSLEISPASPGREKQATPGSGAIVVCGKTFQRRNLGLISALLCGTWGGSCLVPMHYSKGDTGGLGYVISFGTGALLVTIWMWIFRFLYMIAKLKSIREGYAVLPPFHFKVMWLPGATAGTLWSLGNVGSIVAVQQLGQGVGYPASQAALLVAGLWGIFYYREVTRPTTVIKWFMSAFVTIFGILLLGYESSSTGGPGR